MGGELWLMLKSPKECDNALSFLTPGRPILEGDVRWYVNRKSKKALEVAYSANYLSSFGAYFVAREIAKRFNVTRVGASSVGWYSNKDWVTNINKTAYRHRYGSLYACWADWIKDYKLDFNHWYWTAHQHGLTDLIRALKNEILPLEAEITAWFKELDTKNRS